MVRRRFRGLILAGCFAVWGGVGWLTPPAVGQHRLLTSGEDLRAKLSLPAGGSWSGVPLREAVEGLGREQRIGAVLDRRVDPEQVVNFSLHGQSLEQLLKRLASHMDLGVCFIESVAYFGPAETTKKLPTVAAIRRREAERLPRGAAVRFSRTREWSWPMLAVPRELLTQLADEAEVEIVNLDQLPHDLWPAVQLPPLSLADRLTLVLAGFGLTWRYSPDGTKLQLTPMPETAEIAQTYPGKGKPRENAEIIQRLLPQTKVSIEGEGIRVVGSWEAHQMVEDLMQGRRVTRSVEPSKVTGSRTVYTLQVENEPVGGVIKALAEQLKLEVKVQPPAVEKLTERVSFNVADVSREELFRAVLHPAGLTFRLTEDELQILPID